VCIYACLHFDFIAETLKSSVKPFGVVLFCVQQIKNLRNEVRDYRDIIDSHQQQRVSAKGQEDADVREKLNEKNQQISDLITQISVCLRCLP